MGSGGGGGSDSEGMMAMMGQGTPMPGLPVAGSEGAVSDPFEYGKFQNFLPEIQAEGVNPMATGLRPDMFKYTSPNPNGDDPAAAAAAGGAAAGGGRDALAAAMMGGGGFGSAMNGVAPIPGAQQLPTPPGGWASGNVPGWPSGGPGTPHVLPAVNTDPASAAAALAALKASGG